MMWDEGYWGWWMMFPSLLLTLLIAAGAVAVIVALVRRPSFFGGGAGTAGPGPETGSARRVAEERLARGEITPEQFREIVGVLDEGPRRK